jgi:ADP-heptose:LPS heptosyltransferase
VTLVGLPWAAAFVRRFHAYLDDFIVFPGFPGLPERTPDIAHFPIFLTTIQKRNFDLAIQMHGSGSIVNPLIGLWGAKKSAGFYTPGQYRPDESLFMEYPEYGPEIWRHLRLMEFLGIPLQGDELEFPIFEQDRLAFRQIQDHFHIQKNYICIHPGARAAERRWPAAYFAAMADRLASFGYQIVLTGTREESDLTAAVAKNMKTPAIDLAGKTGLGTLAVLVSYAHLLISNDTGISHIASAIKTPSVVLFSTSDPKRWAPQNGQLHKIVQWTIDLTPTEILSQVESHLQETQAYVT